MLHRSKPLDAGSVSSYIGRQWLALPVRECCQGVPQQRPYQL